jgi:hypothetical protein
MGGGGNGTRAAGMPTEGARKLSGEPGLETGKMGISSGGLDGQMSRSALVPPGYKPRPASQRKDQPLGSLETDRQFTVCTLVELMNALN